MRLQDVLNVRRAEILPVALSMVFFFCVLAALMITRPAREALGMQAGLESIRWLFFGTALVTLLVNPLFGWLVSRYRRMMFISAVYLFFACGLAVFYLLLAWYPGTIGIRTGQVFYVWFSVFNLFLTMLFWAVMSDRFSLEQSKRFFPLIAVGGTLGGVFGPWLSCRLAEPMGTPFLLLVSSGFLILALCAAGLLIRVQPAQLQQANDDAQAIGGGAWNGLKAVCGSKYLSGIALYTVILAVITTFLYFTRLQMVSMLGEEIDGRTVLFARIDMITQIATLGFQILGSGHLMKRFGVHITLILLPATAVFGFLGVALMGTLTALIVFESAFRVVQRAVMRPATETLFTVLTLEEKYKAKSVLDTFVHRTGDAAGAQLEGILIRLGMGLAAVAGIAVPMAISWAALGYWLGRKQQRIAASAKKA